MGFKDETLELASGLQLYEVGHVEKRGQDYMLGSSSHEKMIAEKPQQLIFEA